MRLLVLNCGSSTVKFQMLEIAAGEISGAGIRSLARGLVDRLGGDATLEFEVVGEAEDKNALPVRNHEEAVRAIIERLGSIADLAAFSGVAHRVVHGGERFSSAVLIDDDVIDALAALCELAPLHNPPSLAGIRATRSLLGSAVPMVAAFDTSFHHSIPEYAAIYAIPRELALKHKIRRYGFHGFAHEYSAARYREITGSAKEDVNIITLHLGNGCSACAIRAGASVDTSMGFTPLEGLVMGTRSGDLDPALLAFLAQQESVSAGEVETWLNTRSGLLGVSELSSDMRDLVAEYDTNPRAKLAVDVFCYRARKYLGAYLAALGAAKAVVFSGGIGENSPLVREKICAGMDWCGLLLDKSKNDFMPGTEGRISNDKARIHAFVIPSNEEAVIARQAAILLATNKELPSSS
jgi:acetate kinase